MQGVLISFESQETGKVNEKGEPEFIAKVEMDGSDEEIVHLVANALLTHAAVSHVMVAAIEYYKHLVRMEARKAEKSQKKPLK